jgi:hypothetical protein
VRLWLAMLGVLCASVAPLRAQAPAQVVEWWTAQTAPIPGLVGWWRFNGDAVDYSSTSASGSGVGSPYSTNGVLNRAIFLNGSSSYVSLPTTPNHLGMSEFTFSVWVNAATLSDVNCIYTESYATNSGSARIILNLTAAGNVRFGTSADSRLTTTGAPISAGAWRHIAGTMTAAAIRLYVNGSLTGATNGTFTVVPNDAPLAANIGCNTLAAAGTFFHGSIDDLRIYNRVLTAAEIRDKLWNGGIGTHY